MSKAPRPPVPPHRPRPLLLAGTEPVDEIHGRHGLTALLYPPAAGTCAICGHPADRLTLADRLCTDCAEAA